MYKSVSWHRLCTSRTGTGGSHPFGPVTGTGSDLEESVSKLLREGVLNAVRYVCRSRDMRGHKVRAVEMEEDARVGRSLRQGG